MKTSKDLLSRFEVNKDYNLISMPEIELPPEEADKFLDCLVDESVMKNYARIERMGQPQKFIRHIGFGDGDFLFPAENFNESKYKKQWTQNRIQLTTHKARGAFPIYDDDIEDIKHVENEATFKNHLIALVTKKIANQLEDVAYMSDTAGLNAYAADNLRSKFDGWRYQINHSASGQAYYNDVCGAADIKDACLCESGASCDDEAEDADADFQFAGGIAAQDANAPYNWEFKYHQMIKNMPSKYKKDGLGGFVFLNSDLVTQDYMEALSTRPTNMGDDIFSGKVPAQYGSVPIINVPLMPTTLGQDADGTYGLVGAGDYTDVMLTRKNNLIVGIQRKITVETWRVPPDDATYFYYTIRMDYAIENINAIVFLRCLTHRC